jgi:penicillin amidase
MNLPADRPLEKTVTHDWYAPDRKNRIDEALKDGTVRSVMDAARLQDDVVSMPARRVLRVLTTLQVDEATPGMDLLQRWDATLHAGSAPAALFEVWHRRHLRPGLIAAAVGTLLPDADVADVLPRLLPDESLLADSRVMLSLLEEPGVRLGPHPDEALTRVLSTTLRAAYDDCCSLLGEDPTTWRWGDLHVSVLRHPFGLVDDRTGEMVKVGPVPRGGSGDTVCDTAYDQSFMQTGGSTFRVVMDVGEWDSSLALNSPGQSGDPRSPHFDDLFDPWSRGEYFPLLYSRAAVEEHTESVLMLQPPS